MKQSKSSKETDERLVCPCGTERKERGNYWLQHTTTSAGRRAWGKLHVPKPTFTLSLWILGLSFDGILQVSWQMGLKVVVSKVPMYYLTDSRSNVAIICLLRGLLLPVPEQLVRAQWMCAENNLSCFFSLAFIVTRRLRKRKKKIITVRLLGSIQNQVQLE